MTRVFIKLRPRTPAWTGPPSIKGLFGGRATIDDRIVKLLTLHLKHLRYQQKAVFPTSFPEVELRRFESPTRLLLGDHELIYESESTLNTAAHLFPDIEEELVAGVGHLINIERHRFTGRRLRRLLS